MTDEDEKMLSDWYQEHMRGNSSLNDDQLQLMIRLLDGDVNDTKHVLKICTDKPIGDARLLPYLEAHLEDHRLCILSAPIYYGEVRWLAAEALAAERQEPGINESVRLLGVVKPMNVSQINQLAVEAGIDERRFKGLEKLQMLIELGKAPVYDRVFPFPARLRKAKK